MSFDQGIAFRSTSGYVTDGANDTYCLEGELYPTVRGGQTFGYSVYVYGHRDRNNTVDARLAGTAFVSSNTTAYFQQDLPASGSVTVHCAFGDLGFNGSKFLIKDTTTTLITISKTAFDDKFADATNTSYTAASWPGSETGSAQTFSTTALRLYGNDSSGVTVVAYIRSVQAGGGGSFKPQFANQNCKFIGVGIS